MPQQTDLVVKNGSAVDKTFTALTPASGDGGIAEWALKEGSIASVFPRLTAMARRSNGGQGGRIGGARRSRHLTMKLVVPSSYQDAVTGLTLVNSAAEIHYTVIVPDDYPEDKKADFVAFAANTMNHTLIKSMVRDALPAT